MKNTSKLNLFAAVVLRVLLLIMPVNALAAEDGQGIGVPQAMEAQVKGCFGAVLSPDDDRFYTVHEGFLTQYQIKPFKKIGSIAIDQEPFKARLGYFGGRCYVLMTNDKSKLIITYQGRMFLLDAGTGQILNKLEGTGIIIAAALNDNELVVLLLHVSGPSEPATKTFNLAIWDADTLKLKREIPDLGKSFGFFSYGSYEAMSKIRDRIYLASDKSFVVLNSKTYAPELSVTGFINGGSPKISKNFKKLYLWNVSPEAEVTDHLNGKRTRYADAKRSVLVFDQETREVSIENVNSIAREEFHPVLALPSQISRNKGFLMLSSNSARASLVNLNTGMGLSFHQYESGEAILIKPHGGDDDHKYFQLTPDARKYLMMKNSAGKIVPINDATFAKYNRTEYVQ